MASRKEEKERRRQERLDRQSREEAKTRRRRTLGYAAGGVLAIVAIAAIVAVVTTGGGGESKPGKSSLEAAKPPPVKTEDFDEAVNKANCKFREYKSEGSQHVTPGEDLPAYKTNPPTSGDHDPVPAHDGATEEAPGVGNLLHSLEHGRVQIQYSESLTEIQKQQLKGLFEEDPARVQLFPNDTNMPYDVAGVAWTRLLGCKKMTSTTFDALRAFIVKYRDQGPELIPQPE